jgi:aryl carrier-like protein
MTSVTAATEATLCRLLADVLGVDFVRPQDGFFEVGGDSVLAVQVVARAREAGLAFSVRNLFDHQTPEALAAVIGDLPAATSASGTAAAAQSPLLAFADDEFGDLEDIEDGQQTSHAEAGWETLA